MNKEYLDSLDFSEKVLIGLRLAIQRLIETEAKLGRDLVVMRDGKVMHIPAQQLLDERNTAAKKDSE